VSPPFLLADCVSKRFGERRVLTSASLRAVRGQVRVLFGRNGIGKSTLIKIAAGLVRADSGAVHIDGRVLLRPTLADLARRGLFYLPDHELLSQSMTIGEQLALFAERFGQRSVDEAARLAMIEPFLDRRPGGLSGGELRRAELALALVRRPACLLADEPYRGIAPKDHDALHAIFRGLAADGCAVIVTGHEVASLLELADHITWSTSGTTYELGAPAAARAHENFGKEYGIAGPRRSAPNDRPPGRLGRR
jgi:ABC-type multidrug transport system ATPase subunit